MGTLLLVGMLPGTGHGQEWGVKARSMGEKEANN